MDKLKRLNKLAFVALTALAIVLAVNGPSPARGAGGHGFGAGQSSGSGMHQGFEGHHGLEGHHEFDGHHGFEGHHRFGFGPVFPFYGYYGYYPPTYWYYCPSYGAYYPNVETCPEAWVPVPAS
jgi:hypothetical protein